MARPRTLSEQQTARVLEVFKLRGDPATRRAAPTLVQLARELKCSMSTLYRAVKRVKTAIAK